MIIAQIALTIILFVLFAIIFIYMGFYTSNNLYKPKEKDIKIEKLAKDYNELFNINQQIQLNAHKMEEANRNNYQWYLNQLYNIGTYLKMKHNDDYIFNQLNYLTGQKAITEETSKENQSQLIILNLDKILERISMVGYTGLTKEEKKFLDEESKRNNSQK